ncbi:MAG: hypothetical protein HZB76_00675 [Chlamydiae bacterium]|nr:hypothetical protein [Chlamydiota bacterium]
MLQPFISIILIIKDFAHLAPLSLESILAQKDKDFEIIIVEGSVKKEHFFKGFTENIAQICHVDDPNFTALMNKGLDLARGKYVHFMFAGDVYLSNNVIGYLKKIQEKSNFDLICSSFLLRQLDKSTEVINFSYKEYEKGKLPTRIQSCFFLKKTLKSFNGFDKRYLTRAGFDIICRFFQKIPQENICFVPRVLTDYEYKKLPYKFRFLQAKETILVIYRNFGLLKALRWVCFHDRFSMIKIWLSGLKKAFFLPR